MCFFRDRFYMEKMKCFSDVPWYDKALTTADKEELNKSRDSRSYVVQKLFEDYHTLFESEDLSGNPEVFLATYFDKKIKSNGFGAFMFGNYIPCPTEVFGAILPDERRILLLLATRL